MLRNWKMFLHTLILLSSKCLAQQNRQRKSVSTNRLLTFLGGTCVTLERGVDVQILAQEHWIAPTAPPGAPLRWRASAPPRWRARVRWDTFVAGITAASGEGR